ncbi:MAG TPA: MlaD family protein [bacterium]|nr:MlaD family protein [bacterium]HOL34711.1 MlaD family protein [bacterium]HPP08036.1 MlaD family protein [bacterium]
MKTKGFSLQFRVGLFIFLGLIIFFVFVFSQGKILRGRGYELKVAFNYVGGLDPGAPVRVSGYRVGEVRNIDLVMEQDRPKIIVTVRIKPEIRLGRHSRFMVRNYGIIGEKYMEIISTGLKDTPLIEPGETLLGEDPLPLERLLSVGEDILKNLNSLLVSLNNITRDEKLKEQLHQVVKGTNEVLLKASLAIGNINLLASNWNTTSLELNKTIADVRPELTDLIVSAKSSSQEINKIVLSNSDRINHIISNLDQSTDKLESAITEISANIKDVSQTFVTTGNRINNFIDRIENKGLFADLISDTEIANDVRATIKSLKQTSTDLDIAFTRLGYASQQLSEILSDIRAGKGTIGKLVAKDDLYNQIFDMVQDLKAHPWKILFRGR